MLKFAIIFLVAGLLFLLIYAGKRKKTAFKRFMGILTVLCLLSSTVLGVLYCKKENINIFNRLKSYDMPSKYADVLEKQNDEKAYKYLPTNVFSCNDITYFVNSKNDLFEYKQVDDKLKFVTVQNNIVKISGTKTIKAELYKDGSLKLDGYFLFSKYEETLLSYSNDTIAQNVSDFVLTSNSLLYVTDDGKLYAMGYNEYGQLSDETAKSKSSPVLVADNIVKADISDTHSMMIDKFGTLYACGENTYSQLGNKNAISTTKPIKIMQGVKDVKVGNYYSLILAVNGDLYTAGNNDHGQLGNNGAEYKAELVHILSSVDKIMTNGNTCAALTFDGQLYVWGDNENHKAGTYDVKNLLKPKKIVENVYDFSLTDNGISVITADRDILISDAEKVLEPAILFSAQIPDKYKNKHIDLDQYTTDEA